MREEGECKDGARRLSEVSQFIESIGQTNAAAAWNMCGAMYLEKSVSKDAVVAMLRERIVPEPRLRSAVVASAADKSLYELQDLGKNYDPAQNVFEVDASSFSTSDDVESFCNSIISKPFNQGKDMDLVGERFGG